LVKDETEKKGNKKTTCRILTVTFYHLSLDQKDA
jgi:hypothetical protein